MGPSPSNRRHVLRISIMLRLGVGVCERRRRRLLLSTCDPRGRYILRQGGRVLRDLLMQGFSEYHLASQVRIGRDRKGILRLYRDDNGMGMSGAEVASGKVITRKVITLGVLCVVKGSRVPFCSVSTVLPFARLVRTRRVKGSYACLLRTSLRRLSATVTSKSRVRIGTTIKLGILIFER